MNRNKKIIIVIFIFLAIIGILYLMFGTQSALNKATTVAPVVTPTPTPVVAPAPAPVQLPPSVPVVYNVSIKNFAFDVATLNIRKGDTVMWKNYDSMAHTVTSTTLGPNSVNIGKNETYSFTFTTTGVFPYHCKLHPSMKGQITVS